MQRYQNTLLWGIGSLALGIATITASWSDRSHETSSSAPLLKQPQMTLPRLDQREDTVPPTQSRDPADVHITGDHGQQEQRPTETAPVLDAAAVDRIAVMEAAMDELAVSFALESESIDETWTNAVHNDVQMALEARQLLGTSVDHVECRRELCRIEFIDDPDPDADEFLLQQLSGIDSLLTEHVAETYTDQVGQLRVLVYLARPGHSLPISLN